MGKKCLDSLLSHILACASEFFFPLLKQVSGIGWSATSKAARQGSLIKARPNIVDVVLRGRLGCVYLSGHGYKLGRLLQLDVFVCLDALQV